jgi:GntR family transcriptional regulator
MTTARAAALDDAPAHLRTEVRMNDLIFQLEPIWRAAAENGVCMPSESSLAESLGIGRSKLREGLAQLEVLGIIDRHRGLATAVNAAVLDIQCRMDVRASFSAAIRDAGVVCCRELLEFGAVVLDDDTATRLRAPYGAPALRIVRRWLADGAPARVGITDLLLPRRGADEGIEPTAETSEMASHIWGHRVLWEITTPVPVAVPEAIANWLKRPVGSLVLRLDTVGVMRSGLRVYAAANYYTDLVGMGVVRTVDQQSE